MAVFRVEKTKDFTVMSNHHLRNTELSLKAKGLLSLMLSLPEDWDYTTKGLAHICRDGVDSITTALKELEAKVGFAARYRRVQEKLEELEQLVIDARFECTGPYAKLTTTEYAATLTKMLGIIRSMDEVNES